MPTIRISQIVTTFALLLAPVIAMGQSKAGWIESLPEISNCVSTISSVQATGKGSFQTASYERKKGEQELADEALPPETRLILDWWTPEDPPRDFCARIAIAVDLPKPKEPRRKLQFFPPVGRTRILMRNMEAYLITYPCDTVGCHERAIMHLEITFARRRTITIDLNPHFGSGVEYARSIDFAKLNAAIDEHLKQTDRK